MAFQSHCMSPPVFVLFFKIRQRGGTDTKAGWQIASQPLPHINISVEWGTITERLLRLHPESGHSQFLQISDYHRGLDEYCNNTGNYHWCKPTSSRLRPMMVLHATDFTAFCASSRSVAIVGE
ncbi:hypothetical protein ONS96_004054 [Cadophora gregata f. sp. sojae]|nr:hypothetical protein ONS96_004054 [Cadophora gregata f. sp. sojae]